MEIQLIQGLSNQHCPNISDYGYIPLLSLSGRAIALKPHETINTSYAIRKKWVLYLFLEKNRAIACYTTALEFRNGKCFRRVTEEEYV
ncbi:MAG: hypothetical protein V7K89_20790 [Nostoc sp.]|uniref:hypothetical protein n=1 Tax=Nostoc sp. TaxID=1180 RepID=UPI002FF6A5F4